MMHLRQEQLAEIEAFIIRETKVIEELENDLSQDIKMMRDFVRHCENQLVEAMQKANVDTVERLRQAEQVSQLNGKIALLNK